MEAEKHRVFIVSVRLIRSFEYRNIKTVVIRDVHPGQTVREFQTTVEKVIQEWPGLPLPVRRHHYDCFKIHHQAHGAKASNTAINLDNDEELILHPDKTLEESGIRNETEVSFFNRQDYERFKTNPELKW